MTDRISSISVVHISDFGAPLCRLFFEDSATTGMYTLSLHDALPIFRPCNGADSYGPPGGEIVPSMVAADTNVRSEEHTSELQSPYDLVCRLLLEKNTIKLDEIYMHIHLTLQQLTY